MHVSGNLPEISNSFLGSFHRDLMHIHYVMIIHLLIPKTVCHVFLLKHLQPGCSVRWVLSLSLNFSSVMNIDCHTNKS